MIMARRLSAVQRATAEAAPDKAGLARADATENNTLFGLLRDGDPGVRLTALDNLVTRARSIAEIVRRYEVTGSSLGYEDIRSIHQAEEIIKELGKAGIEDATVRAARRIVDDARRIREMATGKITLSPTF